MKSLLLQWVLFFFSEHAYSLASPFALLRLRKPPRVSMSSRTMLALIGMDPKQETGDQHDNHEEKIISSFFGEVLSGCSNLPDDFVWELKVEELSLDMVQTKTSLMEMCSKMNKSFPEMKCEVINYRKIDSAEMVLNEHPCCWYEVSVQRSGSFSGEPLTLGKMPTLEPTGKYVEMGIERHLLLLDESTGKVIRAKTTTKNPLLYDAIVNSTAC